jgi:Tol biopolymer transport system component
MLRVRTLKLERNGIGMRELMMLGAALAALASVAAIALVPSGDDVPAGRIGYHAGDVERWVTASGEPVGVPPDWPPRSPVGVQSSVTPALGLGQVASPDGDAIAYVSITDERAWSIWRLTVKEGHRVTEVGQLGGGDGPRLVAKNGKGAARSSDGVPLVVRWSPDGTKLAWGSVSGSPYNLHVAERGSWVTRSYPMDGGYAGELAWSPDGRYVAVSTYEKDRSDHTLLVLDTTESHGPTRLAKGCVVVWAPDSRHLVLHGEPRTQPGLLVVSVTGDVQRVSERKDVAPFAWVAN